MADKKGFTLIELVVVMIIVGICLAFAIPSYIGSMEQTKAQAAQNNLLAIAAAQSKFNEDYSSYCTSQSISPCYCTTTTGNVANCGNNMNNLNGNLHLSIFGNDPFSYSCTVSGAYYACTADDTIVKLTLTVTATGASVSCSPDGSNPSSYCPSASYQ